MKFPNNRVKEFLKDVEVYQPPIKKRKQKPIERICTSKGWMVDPVIVTASNYGKLDTDLAWLLIRIDNFCYYDADGVLHVFFGSDKYLATLSNCSISTIQRRLQKLKEMELILVWTKTEKKGRNIPITNRYICTPWTKNQNTWFQKWFKKWIG